MMKHLGESGIRESYLLFEYRNLILDHLTEKGKCYQTSKKYG